MGKLNIEKITNYVESNIGTFHERRYQFLERAKLEEILCRKNPYLFKAKNVLTAGDLVKGLLDAYLSSQEEAMFGDFLEGLAIFICGQVYAGKKSAAEGIDLEFEKDGIKYIVAIKSGPNWGNSSQIRKMKENFRKAIQTLKSSGAKARIEAINGCCYSRIKKEDKVEYHKICGQRFWEFISGDPNLYLDIIKPLGFKAKEKNEQFHISYSNLINTFTQEFINTYCLEDGSINWDFIVKINSALEKPDTSRKKRKIL
jgi:uncharacterized protein YegP (UPF0339 family)